MTTHTKATISADPDIPAISITRDFAASVEQLVKAHTDPELYMRWVGPDDLETTIDYWDARTGGSWRFVQRRGDEEFAFHGCFHEVSPTRLVQTFTWEGMPDGVSLDTMTFEDLGDGRTRLHGRSIVDGFAARDAMLESGMETGVDEGYAKLDRLLAGDTL
ncbi:SRPBCC family protein [Tsukamurella sp. 8F]|uniref:SRPBCC family protein n=1 Tax=unclassified Tsukamurella TaxID=2633480 RepID=UPI0023B8A461|nr:MULTISPECIES: SRPBCC family protein [unclassified Tsukamurella]MDF0528485.1 SRPBCC family protein [Tsukamurella sp. 8J]MDF0586311.1 SRPBCC family protein [Tsukamurella sp. 8F]